MSWENAAHQNRETISAVQRIESRKRDAILRKLYTIAGEIEAEVAKEKARSEAPALTRKKQE